MSTALRRARRSGRIGDLIQSAKRGPRSLANPELFRDGSVALRIFLPQVLEQPSALADEHEQAAPRVVVLLVGLEVVGQAVDPLREERDLNLGRSGVALVHLELLDQALLLVRRQSHTGILPGVPPPIATSPGPRLRLRWDGFVNRSNPRQDRAECITHPSAFQLAWARRSRRASSMSAKTWARSSSTPGNFRSGRIRRRKSSVSGRS